MSTFSDLLGSIGAKFQLGLGNALLKGTSSTAISLRDAADGADASLTAAQVAVSGATGVVLNSAASESGGSWKTTLSPSTSGMTGDNTIVLPVADGSAGQFLSTNGSGQWAFTTPSGEPKFTTNLVFGSSSPLALGTLPASATVDSIQVIVDTMFNTAATVEIGILGNLAKYMATTQSNLQATGTTGFTMYPNLLPDGSSEALIATYTSSGASAGAARIIVSYH
jgi:hypothetical protein